MIATFGHSTLTPDEAIGQLDAGGVDVLIDVRSDPTSTFGRWRREQLAKWVPFLTAGQIAYQWWPELGGWDVRHCADGALVRYLAEQGVNLSAYSGGTLPGGRVPAPRGRPDWTSVGLRDYAWFTSTPEFNKGMDRLVAMFGRTDQPTAALMCSEAAPQRCHRSMIADVLVARGVEVRHLPRWQDHLDWDVYGRIGRYPEPVRSCWHGVTREAARL